MGILTIKVLVKPANNPLKYVRVEAGGNIGSTDNNGIAKFSIPDGKYTVKMRAADYRPFTGELSCPGEYTIETQFARY